MNIFQLQPELTQSSSLVQFSHSVMSDTVWPHEPQHARPSCPSPTPGVHPNPCPSSRWCHPTISSYIVPFSSSSQSFPASGSFQNESALRIRQFTGGQIVSPGYILAKLPATINRSPWRLMGFSGGTSGKEPACQCRRCKRCGFDPWVRGSPWERKWQLSPVWTEKPGSLGHEDPQGKEMATHYSIFACRILWTEQPSRLGYCPQGCKESYTTEAT